VVREQRAEAMAVIERRAQDVGATLLREHRDFGLAGRTQAVGGQAIRIRGRHGSYDDLFLPLFGEGPARSAAASVAAVEALLGRALDEQAVRAALASASSPGRVEVLGRHPLVIVDGAHNLDAAEALVRTLGEAFTWDRLHLVIATFEDKDVEGIARLLAPVTDAAYVARNSSRRSAAPARVAEALRGSGVAAVEMFQDVPAAVAAARAAAREDDAILVTGSFYTVADARGLLADPA
jgi:dihydrofolate synthase/folylpolyglutamate synthase